MPDSELRVFISSRESQCDECKEDLGWHAWITLSRQRGCLCLACADLDHLALLSPGDAALTRRARKHSTLCAIVLKWSSARKRYERQGILVDEQALERAEKECLDDAEFRKRRAVREGERRAEQDDVYITRFGERIREIYPSCPVRSARAIAEHACRKYSGRIGRSAGGKRLDEEAIALAVAAHVRHCETPYDALLARGIDRHEARQQVRHDVERIVDGWRQPPSAVDLDV